MTSEPDSTPRRRPPTIDLTATEVEADKPAAAAQSGAGNAAAGRAGSDFFGRLARHAVAAVAGALVMAAIVAGLWLAGYWPLREPAAPPGAQRAQPSAIDDIAARLDKIQGALQAQQVEPALAARLAAADAATKALGDSLSALGRRVDEIATTAQGALAQAKAASAAAAAAAAAADQAKGAARSGVQRGDLDALAGRIAALEGTVKALANDTTRRPAAADDRAARLTIAAEALRAAVERDAPYQAELAAVHALGVGQDAAAPLQQFAAGGVPSAATLARELAMLTPALLRGSGAVRSETGLMGRLETSAQKLVRITPIDAPAGDDPAAVIARLNADAAHADIAGALSDIARLPAPAKALAAPWTKQAEARNAAIAASQRIAAAAIAALGGPNRQ